MRNPKIPVCAIYTDKVEALLALARDFSRSDFLALACAAADQAGTSSEAGDAIHAIIVEAQRKAAEERERWEEDAEKDRARARADAARAEDFGAER